MNENVNWSWIAGLFEGEGSIFISLCTYKDGWKRYTLHTSVAMTDEEIINILKEFLEGTLCVHNIGTKQNNKKTSYQWSLTSKKAGIFLENIEPYIVSKRVKDKITLALEFQKQKKKGAASRYIEGYGETQEQFYLKMKELNRRGFT